MVTTMAGKSRYPIFVSEKAGKLLRIICCIFGLILIKLLYLVTYTHEKAIQVAINSQKKTEIHKPARASIVDRMHIPLAINQLQYTVGVQYGEIKQIPRTKTIHNKKIYPRKEYITKLAAFLGEALNLDAQKVEDTIYAQASLYYNTPCILKNNLTETTFARLKLAEKDWPGLVVDYASTRYYPFDHDASEITGYIGPISQSAYDMILQQEKSLKQAQDDIDHQEKLQELEALGYTRNDWVGQSGLEKEFDALLRGKIGKQTYLIDIYGNPLEQLHSSPPSPGKQIVSTLSIEMQSFAQQLLAEYESKPLPYEEHLPEYTPWMRGGAIIVMEPNTGEILTLASYPKQSANDFTQAIEHRNEKIAQWLENNTSIAHIWQGKTPLIRERFDVQRKAFYSEKLFLTWKDYLKCILPPSSPVRKVITEKCLVQEGLFAIRLFSTAVHLMSYEGLSITPAKVIDFLYPERPVGVLITLEENRQMARKKEEFHGVLEEIKHQLAPFFSSIPLNYDKLLLLDLYRLLLDETKIIGQIQEELKYCSLEHLYQLTNAYVNLSDMLKEASKDAFHATLFQTWRTESFPQFLSQKRKEEKTRHKAVKPFTEYLAEGELLLFQDYWKQNKLDILSQFISNQLDVSQPIHAALHVWRQSCKETAPWIRHVQQLASLCNASIPIASLLDTLRIWEDLQRPLWGKYPFLPKDSDHIQKEYLLAGAFYPREHFGFCRSLAYQCAVPVGSIYKVIPAYTYLCQRLHQHKPLNHFSIIDDPHKSSAAVGGWNIGFTAEGMPIPLFYKEGKLPRSAHRGIGSIDMIRALGASSNPFFSMLTHELEDPEDLIATSRYFGLGSKTGIRLPGEAKGSLPNDIAYNKTGLYSLAIGQHTLTGTPLQMAVLLSALATGTKVTPRITQEDPYEGTPLFLPKEIQKLILQGLNNTIWGEKGTARHIKRLFPLETLQGIIGKTGTAEYIERVSLDGATGARKQQHIWFGAISFKDEHPELVVIVFLRQGSFGKDAAPYAIRMIDKYRTLRKQGSLSKCPR